MGFFARRESQQDASAEGKDDAGSKSENKKNNAVNCRQKVRIILATIFAFFIMGASSTALFSAGWFIQFPITNNNNDQGEIARDGTNDVDCPQIADCLGCVQSGKCGWCGSRSRCSAGWELDPSIQSKDSLEFSSGPKVCEVIDGWAYERTGCPVMREIKQFGLMYYCEAPVSSGEKSGEVCQKNVLFHSDSVCKRFQEKREARKESGQDVSETCAFEKPKDRDECEAMEIICGAQGFLLVGAQGAVFATTFIAIICAYFLMVQKPAESLREAYPNESIESLVESYVMKRRVAFVAIIGCHLLSACCMLILILLWKSFTDAMIAASKQYADPTIGAKPAFESEFGNAYYASITATVGAFIAGGIMLIEFLDPDNDKKSLAKQAAIAIRGVNGNIGGGRTASGAHAMAEDDEMEAAIAMSLSAMPTDEIQGSTSNEENHSHTPQSESAINSRSESTEMSTDANGDKKRKSSRKNSKRDGEGFKKKVKEKLIVV